MSWSKVKKGPKPFMWWFHKIMCEIWWSMRNISNDDMYYYHLNIMNEKYKINLYGEKIV